MSELPPVSPLPPRGLARFLHRLLSSRLNCALERSLPFRILVWRLAPRLMRLSGDRLPLLPLAAAVLETRDARNGRRHRRAAVYFSDGEDAILIPSKGGMDSDPHWFENALADPEVRFGGIPFRAEVVVDEDEIRRLQALGDAYFPAYATYRSHAARFGRKIPILRLRPRPEGDDGSRVTRLGRIELTLSAVANRRGVYLGRRSTRIHCAIYRRSGGRLGARMPGFRGVGIALVDHLGARTGARRTSPLMYLRDGEAVVVVASKAGQPSHPAWFHNLMAHPETTVQIGPERRAVRARTATEEEYPRLWAQLVTMYPGFEEFARAAAPRRIPLVVLEPRR